MRKLFVTLLLCAAASITVQAQTLIHYWNFNEFSTQTAQLTSTFTLNDDPMVIQADLQGATEIQLSSNTGQSFAGANARMGDEAGAHLRFNNPIGSTLTIPLPSTGYENLVFKYETRRSGSGADTQIISYTVDGTTFLPLLNITITEVPLIQTLDFSAISSAADNPDFAIRIAFDDSNDPKNMAGNNRFDNMTLEGDAMAGTNQPPVVAHAVDFQELGSGEEYEPWSRMTFNLNTIFSDPDEDELSFGVESSHPGIASVTLNGDVAEVRGISAGNAVITFTASDGHNPEISTNFLVLVYPEPYTFEFSDEYAFTSWSPINPAGAFPPGMIFVQSDVSDPGLDDPLHYAYHIPLSDAAVPIDADFPYDAESRTRINGMGDEGITFINTGRGRDLGAAILSLDIRWARAANLSFLAGTYLANSRPYNLRVLYREAPADTWKPLTENGLIVEYLHNTTDGHTQNFGPIYLPDALMSPYFQLKFRYYNTGEVTSGPRARLRLDNIVVDGLVVNSADRPDAIASQITLHPNYPNPFNPATEIRFTLPEASDIRLEVFDLTGRQIALLREGFISEGNHTVTFDASHLASGAYIYRLQANGVTRTRLMSLIR